MNIQLHKNARTTPAIRLELQSQAESVSDRELAEAYHLNRHAVAKWRQREGVEDASHRPHRFHATLSTAQEAVVVALRETLLPLPLDDLLAVTRSSIPKCRAPAWIVVCAAMGFLTSCTSSICPKCRMRTIGSTSLPRLTAPTRWVYVELLQDKSAALPAVSSRA